MCVRGLFVGRKKRIRSLTRENQQILTPTRVLRTQELSLQPPESQEHSPVRRNKPTTRESTSSQQVRTSKMYLTKLLPLQPVQMPGTSGCEMEGHAF